MVLTVLSALARLGIDPWQEAARLAQLPPETATQRLTSIVAGLPNGRWAPADAGIIAARLVGLLPAKRAFDLPTRVAASHLAPAKAQIAMLLFVAALGGLTFFAMSGRMFPATNVNIDHPVPSPAALPQALAADAK
ncbi:MAG TPA: hypothetical protein VNF99_12265 [Stellaceae bacterium]|nr:hypothetical protein [Stellaceae bacterium]